MLGGRSEITAHFTSAPFMYQEREDNRMEKVLSSYDVVGGPHTFNVVWATTKFANKNRKVLEVTRPMTVGLAALVNVHMLDSHFLLTFATHASNVIRVTERSDARGVARLGLFVHRSSYYWSTHDREYADRRFKQRAKRIHDGRDDVPGDANNSRDDSPGDADDVLDPAPAEADPRDDFARPRAGPPGAAFSAPVRALVPRGWIKKS